MGASRWIMMAAVAVSLGVISSGSVVLADGLQAKANEQIWEGTLPVRPGYELLLVVHASTSERESVATLDSPDEGLSGLKLSSVVIDERGSPSS